MFDPYGQTSSEPYEAFNVFTVAAASPNAYYKSFYKRVKLRLFLPAWSLDECVEVASCLEIDKQTTEARFHTFGGVPRSIFCNNKEQQASLLHDLNDAISAGCVDDISRSMVDLQQSVRHKLLQYEVAANFKPTGVRLTSLYVESCMF